MAKVLVTGGTGFTGGKTLTLTVSAAADIALWADIDGCGSWVPVVRFPLTARETKTVAFPRAFGAYWVRLVSDTACTATAQFTYR